MGFRANVVFTGRRPQQEVSIELHDAADPQELARVLRARSAIGRLCTLEYIGEQMYADQRWHDTVAAEGLPSTFEIQPSTAALQTEAHVIFGPNAQP